MYRGTSTSVHTRHPAAGRACGRPTAQSPAGLQGFRAQRGRQAGRQYRVLRGKLSGWLSAAAESSTVQLYSCTAVPLYPYYSCSTTRRSSRCCRTLPRVRRAYYISTCSHFNMYSCSSRLQHSVQLYSCTQHSVCICFVPVLLQLYRYSTS